ncbi:UNKNOWN [Stylonychia lemnae]|uniref:Uncharacterized protein n=1 Tax=Stylonychia lemnae TaxID=5949 RepID=A0A078A8N8_STYLE|nr:UNKNOWN [Stylonychia lemnae]|eukprot:CDW78246.1 UNKNOWN [Stylonychia lemnae]
MFLDFIKHLTLSCSLLSSSKDYSHLVNLNLIFVEVNDFYLGYEGLDWQSNIENSDQILKGDDYSLNMYRGLQQDRLLYQNFGRDNLLFYYKKGVYDQDDLHQLLELFQNIYRTQGTFIRVYYGAIKNQYTLEETIFKYWYEKPKDITFSGSFEQLNDIELSLIIDAFHVWRDDLIIRNHFSFTSPNIMEFKNEFLELLNMPQGKDFIVYLYSDDCGIKCKNTHLFYNQLADHISNVRDVKVAHTDMTSSIFWGIWPYGLPYCRFYSHLIRNNFEYIYEPYKVEDYVKFLKKKSILFLKYMNAKDRQKAAPMTIQQIERDWYVRHCINHESNPKLMMQYLLYHITDYDNVLDLYLQEKVNQERIGYNIYQLSTHKEIEYKYPFFQVVVKGTGGLMKVALVGAPLYKDQREKFYQLQLDGYMIIGIQSYRSFPIFNQWEHDTDSRIAANDREFQEIMKYFSGWLHNMREPAKHLPVYIPRMLFAESDLQLFMTESHYPDGTDIENKKYDVMFMNAGNTSWHSDVKNWTLAVDCFREIIAKTDMNIQLVGREAPEDLKDRINVHTFMGFKEFLGVLGETDILLIPSISDASPRILTQALSINTAVIVNKDIVGGWKYINEQTGAFFSTKEEIVDVINLVKERRRKGILRPKAWFQEYSTHIHQKFEVFVENLRMMNFYDRDINGYPFETAL